MQAKIARADLAKNVGDARQVGAADDGLEAPMFDEAVFDDVARDDLADDAAADQRTFDEAEAGGAGGATAGAHDAADAPADAEGGGKKRDARKFAGHCWPTTPMLACAVNCAATRTTLEQVRAIAADVVSGVPHLPTDVAEQVMEELSDPVDASAVATEAAGGGGEGAGAAGAAASPMLVASARLLQLSRPLASMLINVLPTSVDEAFALFPELAQHDPVVVRAVLREMLSLVVVRQRFAEPSQVVERLSFP